MQADRTGYDDGVPYVATLLGGWETFGVPAGHIVWHQSRATFQVGPNEPFRAQLSAAVDYVAKLPPPPPPGIDTTAGSADVWDVGFWGPPGSDPPTQAELDAYCQWDMAEPAAPSMTSTLWVSIGRTGYAHAPIVQITVAQQVKPSVELVVISATYEPAGVNVD